MRHVKPQNTAPEVKLRSLLHKNGFRFRLNRKDLPGKPDIVLPKYKAVIFVHGCFWHGHSCNRGHRPQTNVDFWNRKIESNIARDKKDIDLLHAQGWRVLVVWQCEIKKKNEDQLLSRIKDFLYAGVESKKISQCPSGNYATLNKDL
ncbi:MAG: very short patch repair endonuclease [Oscillospiraceae bacterium]